MSVPHRLDRVLTVLREHGSRITRPRRAIVRALVEIGEHPTADQLADAAKEIEPSVNRSTVYRFLDELERMGIVDHTHLGHGPSVYHFAEDDHQHLVCVECGLVTEIPGHTIDTLRAQVRSTFDFDVDGRHFALVGRCSSCC